MRSVILLLLLAASAPGEVTWTSVPTQCGPGGCGGGSCGPGGCGPIEYGPQYQAPPRQRISPDGVETPPVGSPSTPKFTPLPPPQVTPPQPLNPPIGQPPQKVEPSVDLEAYDKQQKEIAGQQKILIEKHDRSLIILEKIEKNTEAPACNCKETDLSPVTNALAEMSGKLDKVLEQTKPAPPSPTQPTTPDRVSEHVVIVADQNATYWPRLSERINITKNTYHGILVAPLPDFPIGLHPQAVIYKNSSPVRVVKGAHDVDDLLAGLARGNVY